MERAVKTLRKPTTLYPHYYCRPIHLLQTPVRPRFITTTLAATPPVAPRTNLNIPYQIAYLHYITSCSSSTSLRHHLGVFEQLSSKSPPSLRTHCRPRRRPQARRVRRPPGHRDLLPHSLRRCQAYTVIYKARTHLHSLSSPTKLNAHQRI